jgi:hypothetical protein
MREINLNSIQNVAVQITKRGGGNVDTTSANFQVYDEDDVSVQGVTDDVTPIVIVDALLDTSSGYSEGGTYKIKYTVVIGTETLIRWVRRRIKEHYLS